MIMVILILACLLGVEENSGKVVQLMVEIVGANKGSIEKYIRNPCTEVGGRKERH